jgi:cytochrome c oxidase subunit 2
MNVLLASLQTLPEQASTIAPKVDAIFWGLLAISAFMTLGLFAVITFFLIRYRATSDVDRTLSRLSPTSLEVVWTGIPILIFIGLFVWGAVVFAEASKPPADALPIYVVGLQWYWDVRHENGRHEIGDLHVPIGQPVQLIMTSTDVIHDYFIPAFRIKRDVMPGKYTVQWFTATKPGKYRIFCNQYCGTKHSEMGGYVYAMRPEEYEDWLGQQGGAGQESLVQTGARLFRQFGCSGCHGPNSSVHAPPLGGIYGHPVPLEGGGFVTADDQYIHDSILKPDAQIAAGYKPIMPNFTGQITEQEVIALVAYIKSLSQPAPITDANSPPLPSSP